MSIKPYLHQFSFSPSPTWVMWWTQVDATFGELALQLRSPEPRAQHSLSKQSVIKSPSPGEWEVTQQPCGGHLHLLSCLRDQLQELLSVRRQVSLAVWHMQQECAKTLSAHGVPALPVEARELSVGCTAKGILGNVNEFELCLRAQGASEAFDQRNVVVITMAGKGHSPSFMWKGLDR